MNPVIALFTEKLQAVRERQAGLVPVRIRKLFGCRSSAFLRRLEHHDRSARPAIEREEMLERGLRAAVDQAKRDAMAETP